MTTLVLATPLAGWSLPLAQVPDPVFSQRMVGDGVGIDPTGNTLHAPCDGEIVATQGVTHALTLRTSHGIDILMHVGIDTVHLKGAGFESLVQPGQRVRSGEPLLRFDLDYLARKSPSCVTPVLVATGGEVVKRTENRELAVGDFLMEVAIGASTAVKAGKGSGAQTERRQEFTVPFDHGLHARPAATLAAALRGIDADVTIIARGRSANARSTVSMMGLGVQGGDTIEVRAVGADADAALAALAPLLARTSSPDRRPAPAAPVRPRVEGAIGAVVASAGMAAGRAHHLVAAAAVVPPSSGDPKRETESLRRAIAAVRAHLESVAATASADQRTVIAAHVELIQDPELARHAEETIARGASAGDAWRDATRATVDTLAALGDARMRERAADLRDLENQVLRALGGESPDTEATRDVPPGSIVLADDLWPSQLMTLDPARVAGICLAQGGPTSHVAIMAAAMGIPMLVAAGLDVLQVKSGTQVVLDAVRGQLRVDPPAAEWETVQQTIAARATQEAADRVAASQPAVTKDGVRIAVYANLGTVDEAHVAVERGAEGCGLLRTEFLFLERHDAPGEDEQHQVYQQIASTLGNRPLTIRTLDIGGDKPIPYLPLPREENPALGLRGLRTSLWRPDLFRDQLRAILRVQPAAACRIMLPMVTDLDDVRAVRALVDEARRELGVATTPSLGIMIETPASALLAGQLAREVDFFSLGTNDLTQYTLALDRGNTELASRLDGLHPAVLRLIAMASDAGHAAGKEVAVCGGLGSDPAAIPILIGLGIREISVVPGAVPRVKRIIRGLDVAHCRVLAKQALEKHNAAEVRALVPA